MHRLLINAVIGIMVRAADLFRAKVQGVAIANPRAASVAESVKVIAISRGKLATVHRAAEFAKFIFQCRRAGNGYGFAIDAQVVCAHGQNGAAIHSCIA